MSDIQSLFVARSHISETVHTSELRHFFLHVACGCAMAQSSYDGVAIRFIFVFIHRSNDTIQLYNEKTTNKCNRHTVHTDQLSL